MFSLSFFLPNNRGPVVPSHWRHSLEKSFSEPNFTIEGPPLLGFSLPNGKLHLTPFSYVFFHSVEDEFLLDAAWGNEFLLAWLVLMWGMPLQMVYADVASPWTYRMCSSSAELEGPLNSKGAFILEFFFSNTHSITHRLKGHGNEHLGQIFPNLATFFAFPRPHACVWNSTASSGDDPYSPDQLYIRKPFDQCIPTAKWRNGQLNWESQVLLSKKNDADITLFMDLKRYVIQPFVTLNAMGGKPVPSRFATIVQRCGNRWWSHPLLVPSKMFDLHFSNVNKNPSCNILQWCFSLKPAGPKIISLGRDHHRFRMFSMWGTWPVILKGIAQAMLLNLGIAEVTEGWPLKSHLKEHGKYRLIRTT